ncbi:hypothetical protein B0H13DRAFT_2392521 [Mycena leptocephala]|nr:hypothetical protein B0H13DRAFT_2392521 [Mycena leptocephala]
MTGPPVRASWDLTTSGVCKCTGGVPPPGKNPRSPPVTASGPQKAKKPDNIGVVEVTENGVAPEPEEKDDDTMNEDYLVTEDDLHVNDEELYSDPSALLSVATDLIGAL